MSVIRELQADILICGAGIAGIATAYELAVVHGLRDVVVVDPRPPLSLTSDKSSECYRTWWPAGPDGAMIGLMRRSYERLSTWAAASDNRFAMNQRGYLYLTHDPAQVARWQQDATESTQYGAGSLRIHTARGDAYRPAPPQGIDPSLDGADLLWGDALHRHFSYLDRALAAGLHVRQAGWLSAQQLGMWLWEQARASGVRLLRGQLVAIEQRGGAVRAAQIALEGGAVPQRIATPRLVIAAGPMAAELAATAGLSLPIYNELHAKVAISDAQGIVPRHAPLLISDEAVHLPWSDEERALLREEPALRGLLERFPAGAHLRPDGGASSQTVLMLWPYHAERVDPPRFPPDFSAVEPEIILRGLATLLPTLLRYTERLPKPVIDGGYYSRTAENRPLIGPLSVDGLYIVGALSGYGIMAAPAAAELFALQLQGLPLPSYAAAFAPQRYAEPSYAARMAAWGDGQL
ncbi:MAG: FAD-binding oxidoreductase [Anaerolineales bacterium]|nr:FAD-binding oxidoreductase [Anaerolineales bacterium]MCB9129256.1 FAD-binding oxidoreductase [Ardenticatenales bacterium]MCB9171336.1 FAD-binding oxidoreductase [Ardenticatenales bacterium]